MFWKYAANLKFYWNFIEITLRHGCSPVNLLHIFRTHFTKNTSWTAVSERWYNLKAISGTYWLPGFLMMPTNKNTQEEYLGPTQTSMMESFMQEQLPTNKSYCWFYKRLHYRYLAGCNTFFLWKYWGAIIFVDIC